MDKKKIKENLVTGISATVGSTVSSVTTASVIKNNKEMDDVEVVGVESQNATDVPTDEHHNESTVIHPSTHVESVVAIVPENENPQPISPEDIIIDSEPVIYGGPVIDDENLVVIDIDSNIYGGPVEDIEPVIYGGLLPDDIEPIDIDCDIYGGPVDI